MISKAVGLLKTNAFAKATIWMTVGMMFANIGAFFFIFLLIRILTPSDYAVIVSLISVFNLLIVPAGIMQITVVAKVAEAKGKDELGKVSFIYHYFLKRLFFVGVVLLLVAFLFTGVINEFLHIRDARLFLLICISAIGFYFIILARSILQGMSEFKNFSLSTILEMIFKIAFAVILILLGMRIFGAALSFLFSEIIVLLFTMLIVQKKFIRNSQPIPIHVSEILTVGLPTTFMLLGLTSFYTVDVLLVKHYFPEQFSNQAALYAGVSTLGKIIFFGTAGVSSALLPTAAEQYATGKKTKALLFASFGLVAAGAFLVTVFYFLQPRLAFLILGKAEYLAATPYLGIFAVFISLHSLVFLIANYLISVKKLDSAYIVFFGAIIQILGIVLFHNNLTEIIFVSIFSSALLLLVLLLVYIVKSK